MDDAEVDRMTKLVDSLLAKLKAPPKAILSLVNDSDWAFVIKLHSMIEAALNHQLVEHFGDARLTEFFIQLEVGRQKTGKLALIKALDLLPEEARAFIKWLSEARNQTAHRVENLDFNLTTYIAAMGEKAYKNLVENICAMMPSSGIPEMMEIRPRTAVFASVCVILCEIEEYVNALAKSREPEDYSSDEPEKSNPKEP